MHVLFFNLIERTKEGWEEILPPAYMFCFKIIESGMNLPFHFFMQKSLLSGSSWEEFSIYCLGYLKCALFCCDTWVVPCGSQYAQELLWSVCSWNMTPTWQTMALSIPTAVRTVLRSRCVRSGLSRGKGSPQIEN